MLLWLIYIFLFFLISIQLFFCDLTQINSASNIDNIETIIESLHDLCLEYEFSSNIYYYICLNQGLSKIHYVGESDLVVDYSSLINFRESNFIIDKEKSQFHISYFENSTSASLLFQCCPNLDSTHSSIFRWPSSRIQGNESPIIHFGIKNFEFSNNTYQINICSPAFCSQENRKDNLKESDSVLNDLNLSQRGISTNVIYSKDQQNFLKQRTKDIFYHAYYSYIKNAWPQGELKPISCEGGHFDPIKIPYVTLIDTLDTLIVIGDHKEFRNAIKLLTTSLKSFDFDTNISVFETTIRLLGGLLSAHLFAIDPIYNIYDPQLTTDIYSGELLDLAIDLANRMMPAFRTKTGIPYGTVNLRNGVPKGETKIASTAGAGSLLIEFQVLSFLTGNIEYLEAAREAIVGIFKRRSKFDLVGKHINIETGQWLETVSGLGSNSDSFYEYLLKSYPFSDDPELFNMFIDTYRGIKSHILIDDEWFSEVDMFSGARTRQRIENLDAFWPGIEAILGNSKSSSLQLNGFYSIWNDLGFLPEELELDKWKLGQGATNPYYPLRPELIESTYYHFRVTKDRSWLLAGQTILDSIEKFTRTGCGYASVSNIATVELEDSMPSFFLSETVKYLYLLFDEENLLHSKSIIFSTEAHPFDVVQIRTLFQNISSTKSSFPPYSHELAIKARKSLTELRCPVTIWTDNMTTYYISPEKQENNRYEERSIQSVKYFDILFNKNDNQQELLNGNQRCPLQEPPTSTLNPTDLEEEKFTSESDRLSPLKAVDINLGKLGLFNIKVFGDGFKVHSLQDKTTIEVFSVGQPTMTLREITPISMKEFSIMNSGFLSQCLLTIMPDSPGNLSHAFQTSCSNSLFGPQAPINAMGSFEFHPTESFCPTKGSDKKKKKKSKFWWIFDDNKDSKSIEVESKNINSQLSDKVLLIQRGECLFEEKAALAEKMGSVGMIVANTENTLFSMAGSKELENLIKKQLKQEVNSKLVDIPTVLVTKRAAKEIGEYLKELKSTTTNFFANIYVDKSPSFLSTELMGDFTYPKIFSTENNFLVLSSNMWGAFFKSTNGQEWQMYLVDKKEIQTSKLIPSFDFKSYYGSKLSTSAHLEQYPADIYRTIISQKCPSNLKLNKRKNSLQLLKR